VQDAGIAKRLGFDGKSCIHPCQVEPIHGVFSSTPEETAWAGKVLAAWEDQNGAARGVVVVDGEMIEALHIEVAKRILNGAG
jgi:citrate lyase subunit beta/citryl-CoA lyase